MLSQQWIPFALASLHSYLDAGRRRDLRLAAGFSALQVLSSGHGAVFLVIAAGGLLVWHALRGTPIALARWVRDLGVPGVLLLAPAAAVPAAAQTVTGTLQGTVNDSSGAVLPGVTITIVNDETGARREVVTNEVGFYHAPYLAIGRYTVTAKLDGFQTVVREGVQVSLTDTRVLNFEQKPSGVAETLTVTGAAPRVNSTNAEVKSVLTYEWCRIPVDELAKHATKVPFEIVADSAEMGRKMALELVELIEARNSEGRATGAIVPCGPASWYAPWTEEVNARGLSLEHLTVFHMDECLDAQGRPVPAEHPYNFRAFMEREFYGGIAQDRNVPEARRFWLLPSTAERVAEAIVEAPIALTLGGWGQGGHVAYNQARRHPSDTVSLQELADSTIRIQENNLDTIIALAHRTFGAAYQFMNAPMK